MLRALTFFFFQKVDLNHLNFKVNLRMYVGKGLYVFWEITRKGHRNFKNHTSNSFSRSKENREKASFL